MKMKMKRPSIAFGLAMFAAIGTFLFGYDTGVGITLIGQKSFLEYMKDPSNDLIGAISSVYTAGEALGTLFQVAAGDKLGRIRFMQLLCVLVTIGTALQTASMTIGQFIGGRGLTGFAVGGLVSTVPLYLSELASPHARGFISGLSGCGLAFGLMLANWVGVACSYAPYGQLQWRLQISLQLPWGVILLIGLTTFMPESPRYYLRRGMVAQAQEAFVRARRDMDSFETQKEFSLMKSRIEYEAQQETGLLIWRYRHRAAVSLSVSLMTALSGAAVVGYYQVILYHSLGVSSQMSLVLAGVHGTVSFCAAVFCVRFLLEQWGRRRVLLFGMAASSVIMVYMAVMQMKFQDSNSRIGKGFAVLGIYLYALVNAAMLEGATMVYVPELLPVAIRSKVAALGGFLSFAVNVGLTEAGPRAFATIKQNYYYVFVGCNVCFLVVGYFWWPETRHKSLEEVAGLFGDRVVEASSSASIDDGATLCERTSSGSTKKTDTTVSVSV